jgi:MOSC domain-containing protein YiiM
MVEHLFLKPAVPSSPLVSTTAYDVTLNGIVNSRNEHVLKQLLVLPQDTLTDFELRPGQLKEDMVITPSFDFHSLSSGTTLRIGTVELRLTFHCEPCSKIKTIVNPKKVLHRRGYHSQVIQAGRIQLGDTVTVLEQRHEAIPYALADRIKWYLERHPVPIYAADLVKAIGLSASYCRAVPNVLRNRKDIDVALILYKNKQRN